MSAKMLKTVYLMHITAFSTYPISIFAKLSFCAMIITKK